MSEFTEFEKQYSRSTRMAYYHMETATVVESWSSRKPIILLLFRQDLASKSSHVSSNFTTVAKRVMWIIAVLESECCLEPYRAQSDDPRGHIMFIRGCFNCCRPLLRRLRVSPFNDFSFHLRWSSGTPIILKLFRRYLASKSLHFYFYHNSLNRVSIFM